MRLTAEDIKRLNYIKYTSFRQFVKSPRSLFMCYVVFFLKLLKRMLFFKQYKLRAVRKELLFLVPSQNNQKSVRTICEHLDEEQYEYWDVVRIHVPLARVYLISLIYLPAFQKLYNKSCKEDRALMRRYHMNFMTTCGTYKVVEEIMRRSDRLKMIVMANDHNLVNRCMIELGEKYGKKTLYVQHASVTERFPSLQFTYSFLDGKESYEKYHRIGNIRGQVFLSGSPRFDELVKYQGCKKEYDVGIALNMMDSCQAALELCKYIQENVTNKVIVRPHPGMGKLFDAESFVRMGVDISYPKEESSYRFLSRISKMVANESGIHLDAAMMRVPSVLYNFSGDEILDWYSYIKKGLVRVCHSHDEVKLFMAENKTDNTLEAIRYYAASFQTPMEGHVGEMIATFIKKDVYESSDAATAYIGGIMRHGEGYLEYKDK